jgi:predicted amidophosphoribosyltransferase
MSETRLHEELDALGIPDPDEMLCVRCEADYPLEGDTLCRDCRSEIDLAHGDLPGAGGE